MNLNCEKQHFSCSDIIIGLSFIIGLSILGYFLCSTYIKSKKMDRLITVTGLSERIVTSDFAIWTINFKSTGNDLLAVSNHIDIDKQTITNFLLKQGFAQDEITLAKYSVTDLLAQQYRNNNTTDYRYIINASLELRSSKINLIPSTIQKVRELVQQGIVLESNSGYYPTNIRYEFTKLNEIKPEMLAEATKNAFESAKQFTNDSGSKLGKIHRATQGDFVVGAYYGPAIESLKTAIPMSRSYIAVSGDNSTIEKKVRVMTTIEYYLVD
ncbi:MAG: SIMPL domain-containing protein [Rickettsiales endosymbiont of Dermacentor nuttalli]